MFTREKCVSLLELCLHVKLQKTSDRKVRDTVGRERRLWNTDSQDHACVAFDWLNYFSEERPILMGKTTKYLYVFDDDEFISAIKTTVSLT